MPTELLPRNYYRLPWSLTDNGISWLEVTTSCNLACKGCYRPKTEGHKTLADIADDLAVFKRERRSDCMSIAGGDPLVHPKIVDIVRMVSQGGWKPIINTNGLALSAKRLKQLKAAGVFGFTFHIDVSQTRRDSNGTVESDHNPLRLKFARMLAKEGGLTCSFNQTVTTETLDQVPEIVKWAQGHPDIVNTVVFILYREPRLMGDFDFYANGKKVDLHETYEDSDAWAGTRTLKAADVVAKIREADPTYEPSAYLNGSTDANSVKWLLASRIASRRRAFGYVTPRFMELVQAGSHFFRKRWLSYSSPRTLGAGRSAMLLSSLFDRGMWKVSKNFLGTVLRMPGSVFEKAYVQTLTIIQPVDALEDGGFDMCDGCPDMTVYKGKMYWSCRLEEVKRFGCFVNAVPRRQACRTQVHPFSRGSS
jgi:pyruvate-formate lyase-activating enzyme